MAGAQPMPSPQSANEMKAAIAAAARSGGSRRIVQQHQRCAGFVGGEGGPMGLSMSGINQGGALGNIRSLDYQGVQFGYNFQNAPVTVYAGFDTLKYNTGIGGPFAAFDSTSGTLPGYSAHAGVEFRPTSNLSLSLGFGYTQQSGRIDSDINSQLLPGASPLAVGGPR